MKHQTSWEEQQPSDGQGAVLKRYAKNILIHTEFTGQINRFFTGTKITNCKSWSYFRT